MALVLVLSACGQAPIQPSPTHIRAEQPAPEGAIPAPVQVAPLLPPPSPAQRAETYTVVVNNVRVQDLLFALARDAKLNVDISPGVQGNVTLNAIDQTLPQILSRISKQVDMRYEIDGPTLSVMRDSPYLRVYRVDYVNLARDTTNQANLSTQVSGTSAAGGAGGGGAGTANNSTSIIKTTSVNKFWDTLINNIKDILRETDKVIPLGTQAAAPPGNTPPAATAAPGTAPVQQVVLAQPQMEFREAASVIANAEAGVLTIRATSRQHEKVQEFLDQVLANVKRQVLIEATIAEVQLNNQYQRGIDWTRLGGPHGLSLTPNSSVAPATLTTARNTFVLGFFQPGLNISGTLQLLESFGDVRVLSSPKVSVLNNQTAVLKVVDNLVYFTVQAQTTTSQTTALTTFTTTVNSVPVGFLMSVVPQISENDTVLLNIRPTISRKVGDVQDPNPALANPCGNNPVAQPGCQPIASLIPVIQTREMESVMRVQSGQTAVLGGLIQDTVTNNEDTIPGVNRVPGVGQLLAQRKDLNQKTELVIFLRPVVIRSPSIEGDYAGYRDLVPGKDYFQKPNPSRVPAAE
ncbi:MAG TPA: secretin N-terminal domain-containing protein [Burkholderiales bacterium]|jgi:general secretion pathway protein D|nr:secretin N-terminal domain-containing protein [Burkholderiales bacterium]